MNEKTDPSPAGPLGNGEDKLPPPETIDGNGRGRPAKSCCLLALTVMLVLFALAVAAVASIVIVDSIHLRG